MSHSHWCWSLALKLSPSPQPVSRWRRGLSDHSGISFQEGPGWLPAVGGGSFVEAIQHLAWLGEARLPLLWSQPFSYFCLKSASRTRPAPPPVGIGGAGIWCLDQHLFCAEPLGAWPSLSATSWLGVGVGVAGPGMRTSKALTSPGSCLEGQTGKRRPLEGKRLSRS